MYIYINMSIEVQSPVNIMLALYFLRVQYTLHKACFLASALCVCKPGLERGLLAQSCQCLKED